MDFVHHSIMVNEVLAVLAPADGELFVDGTLGGGGHAAALLSAADIRLIGIDRDPAALVAAGARLVEFGARVTLRHGEFGNMEQLLDGVQVDAVLLDVGVSSPQFDQAERGFSFSHAGPIDMRMNPTAGPTAAELLRTLPVDELSRILRDFGEERYHRRVAEALSDAAQAGRLQTTLQLAELVARAIPAHSQRGQRIHPATRTFQALRIAVNGELDELARFLAAFPRLLRTGGRCAIISFHSLEDRLVKHCFRDLSWRSSLPPKYAAEAGERVEAVCEPITKKAVFASEDEITQNPRARSARLRACRRTRADVLPTHRRPS